jgi:hypothetical protein
MLTYMPSLPDADADTEMVNGPSGTPARTFANGEYPRVRLVDVEAVDLALVQRHAQHREGHAAAWACCATKPPSTMGCRRPNKVVCPDRSTPPHAQSGASAAVRLGAPGTAGGIVASSWLVLWEPARKW